MKKNLMLIKTKTSKSTKKDQSINEENHQSMEINSP
jgi:hypothetical protein